MSKQEYAQLVKKLSKPSPMGKDLALAFVVGGGICALGQLIQIGFEAMGLDQESSGAATTMSLIFLSALMTGLGLYDKLAKHAGAGTLVPVTGFANSIVSPAIEFKSEGFCASGGMASKMFTIAGPVIVFGVGSSVVYGLVLVLFQWLTGGA